MRSLSRLALGTSLLLCAASAGATDLVYYGEIQRIIQNKCMACHHDGGIGSGSFENPGALIARSGLVFQRVRDREMPPWNANHVLPFADPEQGYKYNRNLSQQEID